MIRFFADHPTASNLMMIAFLVIGLIAAPQLRRETFPQSDPDQVEITVPFKGASAADVEDAICQRIEDAVGEVADVAELRCESREGMGRAVVEMREGADYDSFFLDIKAEVEAIDTFPSEAESPVIAQLGQTYFIASIALTGPMTPPALKSYAEAVKDRMLRWGGITQVDVTGFSDHQILIEIPAVTLRQYGLTVADIAATVSRQNVDLPAGSIETGERDILIRFDDERKRLREFGDLVVVSGIGGGQVRLGDMATITDRFELDEDKVIFNGRRAALLDVTKTSGEDTLVVIDAVTAFLDSERMTAPPGVEMTITQDGSSIVRDRLQMLLKNGAQGLLLVFLVMWLFFGFRYSFWVAMGLPVSFFGAIGAMLMLDYSINMLTMVGLLIAIGLLMDDAIVISENVASHRRKGKRPLDAAVAGAREVMPGVISSYLTTVFVFGSLVFLKGNIGAVLKVVPVVMLLVLTVSLVEAFLILPHHLGHSLGRSKTGKLAERIEIFVHWMRDRVVGRAVDACVKWRYATVGTAVAILLVAISMLAGGVVKFIAFPELDGDVLEARILLPQGTPLTRTEATVEQVVQALRRVDETLTPQQPGGQRLVNNVNVRFNVNKDAFESGPHVATVTADFLGAEERSTKGDEILAAWRDEIGSLADVINIKFAAATVGLAGLPIDIRLIGDDLGQLKAASRELVGWLGRYQGVYDLSDDIRVGKPELRIRLRDGAGALGLDARMIADQLRAAFLGAGAGEIQLGAEAYDVQVRLSKIDQNTLSDLDYFTVTTSSGDQVPLSVVATVERDRGWARINRVDGRRAVSVQGDVDTRIANANDIVSDTMNSFIPKLLASYPGVEVSIEGENKEAGTTQRSMISGFMIGLIGVFLLLSFQFRSYVEPLVVMVAIPLAFTGVVVGHMVMGLSISMPSILGFVSLTGIVVNNSILLVAFTKLGRARGLSISEASREASRQRFRPILITSLTTLFGLLPILSETSLQAQILIPLVTSLVFGLMASAVLVLMVLPSLFTILGDFGLSREEPKETPVGRGHKVAEEIQV